MDPVSGAAAAAAIAGGADLVGSLIGSGVDKHESRNNRREARRQFNIQDEYNKNRIQYTVKDALKAGVNPLAALSGGSGSYSPTIHAGGSSGQGDIISRGFSSVGDRIQNAINSFYERKNREAVNLDVKSKKLDVESKQLENKLLKSKIDTASQPGFADSVTITDPVTITDILQGKGYDFSDIGKAKAPSLLKKWALPDGRVVQLIDPDAISDADFTNVEAARAILMSYPSLKDDRGVRFNQKFSGRNFRNYLTHRK